MTDFAFGFDSFHVDNCRSKGDHNDSDWLILTVTNGQTVFPAQTKQIGGNLHAGDSIESLFLGPFSIDESQFTTATFVVVNLSKDEDQAGKALEIGGSIGAAIGGGVGLAGVIGQSAAVAIAGAITGLVGGVVAIVGQVIGASSDPNCDGEVFTRVLTFLPGEIKSQSIGPTTETAKSPHECGNDPHTTVTYGVKFFRHHIPGGVVF